MNEISWIPQLVSIQLNIFQSKSKSNEICHHYSLEKSYLIRMKLCTYQDSCAVLVCAKYHCDDSNRYINTEYHTSIKFYVQSKVGQVVGVEIQAWEFREKEPIMGCESARNGHDCRAFKVHPGAVNTWVANNGTSLMLWDHSRPSKATKSYRGQKIPFSFIIANKGKWHTQGLLFVLYW